MNTFRSWSRRAWILHGYLIATLFLMGPVPLLRSGWIDTDSDTTNDAWHDPASSAVTSLADLDAINVDPDGDGAYNSEELMYGSDPFDLDSDDDGLNDGDEIHLANEGQGKDYSLLSWDSNGDGVSDHDDFYGSTSVTYPGGLLPGYPNATYADYDGDGIKNPWDSYPADPLNNDGDQDGINDDTDPATSDASNLSPHNSIAWMGNALRDDDNDAILNFWDSYPYDDSNGSNDSDNDGITNDQDPFPSDYSNYSSANGIYWYGDVFGDADWDGLSNYSDSWPYDPYNGSGDNGGGGSTSNDDDSDGIDNSLDPAPYDPGNYSNINSTNWYDHALEDADNDGQNNWYDAHPYDFYNGISDYDNDGILNADDPFPTDYSNFSSVNQVTWWSNMFGDSDGDNVPNWNDGYPDDPYNNSPDADGDGILNENDPFPLDASNYSPTNGVHWGADVFGDLDFDGTPNWQDEVPNSDVDGDGIVDGLDPAPYDGMNFSDRNYMHWGNPLADDDQDTVPNFWDAWPNDPYNGDTDIDDDGLSNDQDPLPSDPVNRSPYNNIEWFGAALQDADYDGYANFYDLHPYVDNNANSDGDAYLDINDPAPSDPYNYSETNQANWYNNVLGDEDTDGTPNFFDEYPWGPPPPTDNDQDGLDSAQEGVLGTSDTDPDSDDDGLTDGEEVNIFGTSPTNAHHTSQAKGWGNLYTDWQLVDLRDSDGDGIPDRIEQHYGLNPWWAGDARLDRDNNGTSNIEQYNRGIALDADLNAYDADGDGMSDVFEDYYGTVLSKNNGADAVLDADEDGVLNFEEMQLVLSPANANTLSLSSPLGDLMTLMTSVRYPSGDPPLGDIDPANGIPDWAETAKVNPSAPDYASFTRQVGGDLDGDGMSDAWEHKYGCWKYPNGGLDLRSARDAGHDPDHDGLTNLTEFRFGTNPLVPQTQTGVNDRSSFNRQGGAGTPTSIQGAGLMTRYRAQIAADLEEGTVVSKAVHEVFTPVGNGIRPFLKARVTTARTGGGVPQAATSKTYPLPVQLVSKQFSHAVYAGCICSQPDDLPFNTEDCPDCVLGRKACSNCENKSAVCSVCFLINDPDYFCFACDDTGRVPCTICDLDGLVTCQECDGLGLKLVPASPASSPTQTYSSGCPVHDPASNGGSLPAPSSTSHYFFKDSAVIELVFPPGSDAHFNERYQIFVDDVPFTILSKSNARAIVGAPLPGQSTWITVAMLEETRGSVTLSDSAGPRYRKIGLNGVPLADAKPQAQDESGENPEETYVDAYTRQLRHSVSDVYATAESSQLPLMVRRDVQTECWTVRSGLRPKEHPEAAFGAGWTSNVSAFVRFEKLSYPSTASVKATISDEMGARQTFYLQRGQWVHSKEEVLDVKTRKNSFAAISGGDGFTGIKLEKKFGTTCYYEMVVGLKQRFPQDRELGSESEEILTYARLTRVVDRHGNSLVYHYPAGATPTPTLIPSCIEDPDRPGRRISITQNNGVITAVRGPDGITVHYGYAVSGGADGFLTLSHVKRGGAADDLAGAVQYGYEQIGETDPNPAQEVRPVGVTQHLDLSSITDELGRQYVFERAAFLHTITFQDLRYTDMGYGTFAQTSIERVQTGIPRPVTKITRVFDGNSAIDLAGGRTLRAKLQAPSYMDVETAPWTSVAGPAGSYRYEFSEPRPARAVFELNNQAALADENPKSTSVMVNFTKMKIFAPDATPDGTAGVETYTFSPEAGMALLSATDRCGNTTSFTYGSDGYDDPLTEMNATGNQLLAEGKTAEAQAHRKLYSYDPDTRIMTSMTDTLGTSTVYGLQSSGGIRGLKVSEVVTAADGTSRSTFYTYGHETFKGMVTKTWTVSSNEAAAPSSVTQVTLGAPTDATGTNPGWWNEVTQTTGTATAGGMLGTSLTSTTTISDAAGRKRSVIDGRQLVTNFNYDGIGRLERVTHPDGTFKQMNYDLHGNLVKETNENQVATFHQYDKFNRRVQTTLDLNGNGAPDACYTTTGTNGTSGAPAYNGDIATAVTYNERGQILTETDARGKVITRIYDAAGRLTSTQDHTHLTIMEYGANSGGSVFDSSGFKPTKITDPRGVVTDITYDRLYRATEQKVTYGTGAVMHPFTSINSEAALKYQTAASAVSPAREAAALAEVALARARARSDPQMAAARAQAAEEEVAAADAALDPIITARSLAGDAAGMAGEAYQNELALHATLATALDEAVTALNNALSESSGSASAIQSAQDALTAAQANEAAAAGAMQAAADLVPTRTAEHEAAQTALMNAMANAAMAQQLYDTAAQTLLEGETLPSSYVDALNDALAAVTSAQGTLSAAAAGLTEAQNGLGAAQAAAAAAAGAATEAAAHLQYVQGQSGDLGMAVSSAMAAESQARSALQAHEAVVAGALALWNAKWAEYDSFAHDMATAGQNLEAAEDRLAEANDDLAAAEAAMGDAALHAERVTEREAAQVAFDTASATLQPLVAAETAALAACQEAFQNLLTLPSSHLSSQPVATTTTVYDAAGRPVRVTDPLGRVTINTYDGLGQLVQVTEPDLTADTSDNPTVQTFYTHHGKPWKVIDQMGRATTTEYDALGRPVKVTSPAVEGVSAVTTTEYDAAGNAVRVTDALGRETETVYDARNRPVEVIAPTVWDGLEGKFVRPTSTTTYDALGQALTVSDPMGAVTTSHYDKAGRKWKVEAPAASAEAPRPVTRSTYDAGGLVLRVTNALNQTVTNTYDALGRLTTTVDAANISNSFEYDPAGNRTKVTDGRGQATLFVYDGLNRLVAQTFANGDTWTHTHNAVQKLAQTSPRGIVTCYAYDARDRLMTVRAPAQAGAPALGRTYSYDNAGKLLTVTEAGNVAANVSYTYDAMGRVTAESSRGHSHSYIYDLAGNRTQASYSTGRVVETSYDGLNRPEVISEGGRVTRYGYDLGGRAVVLVGGNGQVSSNTYDALGRLVDRTLFKTAAMDPGQVLAEFSWEHDLLGNVKKQHEIWPGDLSRAQGIRTTTMGYDANNRLTSEVVTQPEVSGATPTTTTVYTYDAANNRATKTVSRTIAGEEPISDEDTGHWDYTYNAANQLTGWEKRSAAIAGTLQKGAVLAYDAAGNRSSQTVTEAVAPTLYSTTQPPAAKPGTTTYQWDAQDRLLGVTLPDGRVHNNEYDYRTRRIGTGTKPTANATTSKQTAIVFSGGLSVAEWESETGSLPVSPTVEYTRGPDMGGGVGGLLYSLRTDSGSNTSTAKYNLSNGRGDIVAQASQGATLTWTASYEAYGKRTKETGENKDKQRGNSKDEDPTGYLNEGFRYRDLETGVWLSRDPAGFVDGPNLYAYVKQNPWTSWDPDGLASESEQNWKAKRDEAAASGSKLSKLYYGLRHAAAKLDPFNEDSSLREGISNLGSKAEAGLEKIDNSNAPQVFKSMAKFSVGTGLAGMNLEPITFVSNVVSTAQAVNKQGVSSVIKSMAKSIGNDAVNHPEKLLGGLMTAWAGGKVVPSVTGKLAPGKVKNWWTRGAEGDAAWRSMSFKDKIFHEIGQKTMSGDSFKPYSQLGPVARGRAIVADQGWGRALMSTPDGAQLGIGTTFHTGPTSAVRFAVEKATQAVGSGVLISNQNN